MRATTNEAEMLTSASFKKNTTDSLFIYFFTGLFLTQEHPGNTHEEMSMYINYSSKKNN